MFWRLPSYTHFTYTTLFRSLPPTMLNRAESAPPVIEKVAGLVPTVSASVEVSATLNAEFSFTDCAALVVTTGALRLEEHTAALQAHGELVSRLLPEK